MLLLLITLAFASLPAGKVAVMMVVVVVEVVKFRLARMRVVECYNCGIGNQELCSWRIGDIALVSCNRVGGNDGGRRR